MEDFKIGQKVEWTTGNILSIGCVLEETEKDFILVVTHSIGGRRDIRELIVEKKLLTKIN